MFKKKIASAVVLMISGALVFGTGCSKDDENNGGSGGGSATGGEGGTDGSGGSAGGGIGDCASLCEATAEADCGAEAECLATCTALSALCPDEAEGYLSCGEDADEVTCISGVDIGVITGCEEEGIAIQICAAGMGGGGGMGGMTGK